MAKKESKKVEPSSADKALDDAKGKFTAVMVIGINDKNGLDISTNVPQYSLMHYWLNRANFELLIHEKNNTPSEVKE